MPLCLTLHARTACILEGPGRVAVLRSRALAAGKSPRARQLLLTTNVLPMGSYALHTWPGRSEILLPCPPEDKALDRIDRAPFGIVGPASTYRIPSVDKEHRFSLCLFGQSAWKFRLDPDHRSAGRDAIRVIFECPSDVKIRRVDGAKVLPVLREREGVTG